MPLSGNASAFIRANLEEIQLGRRAKLVVIGSLTATQVADINKFRAHRELPPIVAEVVFIGKHIHQSRIVHDGYTIEDVIDQLQSAMRADSSVLRTGKLTAMECSQPRADRYGNLVRDRVIFECTARYPRPELFSVIPKGDAIKPKK